ncbi:C-terminal binding protein [Gammaproteobacteria bacterium]|nr:C-terminal binding protein [Gammaproteobacteria bacterium]
MAFNILWPAMRWPGDREIESSSVGSNHAIFCERYDDVTEEQWASADAIVTVNDVPDNYREKLGNCRIVVTPKVGFDNINLQAWADLGVPVCNVPDYGTQEVADHAIALMMSLMKGITFHTRELKKDPRGLWRPALNPFGKRLSACTFGVVGLGRIGTAASLRAKAFGMDVIMYDPYRENGAELSLGVKRTHSLEDLFARSDVVSIHAPLSDATEKLINGEILKTSKPGLILINTARGPIVDLDALYHALKNDEIQAVGLDVLPEEPADPDHPLIKAWSDDEDWVADRLLITPHSAFFTPESVYDMRYKGGEVAVTYLSEGRLQNCVNSHLLDAAR